MQALNRWMAGIITVQQVIVVPVTATADPSQLQIQINYTMLASQSAGQLMVTVN